MLVESLTAGNWIGRLSGRGRGPHDSNPLAPSENEYLGDLVE
jgi:hypothetical protein